MFPPRFWPQKEIGPNIAQDQKKVGHRIFNGTKGITPGPGKLPKPFTYWGIIKTLFRFGNRGKPFFIKDKGLWNPRVSTPELNRESLMGRGETQAGEKLPGPGERMGVWLKEKALLGKGEGAKNRETPEKKTAFIRGPPHTG